MSNELLGHYKDFHLERFQNGIKLVDPSRLSNVKSPLFVNKVFSTQCNLYLLNHQGEIQDTNDTHADLVGFTSIEDALGKTAFDVILKPHAQKIRENDLTVLKTEDYLIAEEECLMINNECGINFEGLTIKYPWYNENNKLAGILGCTIAFDNHSLPKCLQQLAEFKLLNFAATQSFKRWKLEEYFKVCLTKRQREVLLLLIRGKTIKQISTILGLSHRTIGHYYEALKIKMNVFTRSELIDKVIDFLI